MTQQEGKASIEDILGSIKRVMARENRELAQGLNQPVGEPDVAANDAEQSEHGPELADPEEAEDVLDLSELGSDEAAGQQGEAPPHGDSAPGDAAAEPDADDEPLTTEQAAAAMRRSLELLAMFEDANAGPRNLRASGTSLEGMVRAMLRPMLAQWLEDNLPEIVERQVQSEIARITSKPG